MRRKAYPRPRFAKAIEGFDRRPSESRGAFRLPLRSAIAVAIAVAAAAVATGAAPAIAQVDAVEGAPKDAASVPGSVDSERRVNHLGMEFVPVPGTHVLFGASEVTVGEYARFLEATGYRPPAKPHFDQEPAHPVVGVNREDAEAFCVWLTETERQQGLIGGNHRYRLPKRLEWNLAVKLEEPFAGRNTLQQEMRSKTYYPWGEKWPPVEGAGNFASDQVEGYDDPFVYTAPVKSFVPNEHGIFDLAGNAWEWCEGDTVSGTPQWVLRGGSWIYFIPETLLASYEYRVAGDLRASSFGFRCVFEDPERASEVTRKIMEAHQKSQEDARARFVTEKNAADAMTVEEAAKQRLALLQKDVPLEIAGGEGTALMNERDRILNRLGGEAKDAPAPPPDGSAVPRPEGRVARMGAEWENSLGLRFRPLEGAPVLFGETEVRVSDYAAFLAANPALTPPKTSFKQEPAHPVVKVTWNDAVSFCHWLTQRERAGGWITERQVYRLPLDAEWSLASGIVGETGATPAERSARQVTTYPWGPEWPPPKRTENLDALKIPNYEDKSVYTAEVGKSPANAAGIFDLGGNVSEWCLDAWTEGSPEKVVRGGSWMTGNAEELVSSYRRKVDAGTVLISLGFRCVLAEQ